LRANLGNRMRIPEAMRPMLQIWSHRNYACFMGGMTPGLVTLWMQRIGTLWLAWELTRSNTWVGIIVAVDYAPMVVLAPFVGAVTDRSDPVHQQKVAQWIVLGLSALNALLIFSGAMNIWLLLVLSLALGCTHPFNAISRHSIVPNTVPKADIPTALATDSALFNVARFIGPALAGIVIEVWGVTATFAVNSFGCAFYLVGLYAMRLEMPERRHAAPRGMLGDIAEGFAYVRGHAGIAPLFLLMTASAIWLRPLQDLLPGYAEGVLNAGASGLGWLTAGMGIGATIAAVFVAVYGTTSGLTLMVLLAFLINLIATLCFVSTGYLWLAVLFGAVWGGTLTLMSTGVQALVQSAVDNAIRGRVMALYTMIYRGVPFLGAIVIGWAGDRIGLQLAFAIAVLLCVFPWLRALRSRGSITVALEGRSNDLDARLLAASRAWAELRYEEIVDLRAGAKSVVSRMCNGAKALAARAREARIGGRLQALLQRKP